ncbi:major intrinsically disordered Notch2-binding receptor 1-like isoform X1 [Paramormyrops kingsleyae]|uniref:major intrinsically disordered Notch2-binding receptor 1-like isoform X1 n=1 Tax=Paramormyrops kingsleyae TaxID=1676925 RepID=UPI003B96B16D
MDPMPEYSHFLGRILEELDAKHNAMSYQDLCKSLCARFDLVHLVKLRSLLFYTACMDPCFPATLFRDKMRNTSEDQQSRKLMAAADIVTMFNLIQMNSGTAKDRLPIAQRPKFQKNQSFESCRSDSDMYKQSDYSRAYDVSYKPTSRVSPCSKSDFGECQPFVPSSNPGRLLGVSRDFKCRAASLEKLQHLPQYPHSSSPSCDMQSTYFPMEIDSESTTDQESLQLKPGLKNRFPSTAGPFSVHSCVEKRNIFKEDFHNFVAFSPHVITVESKSRDDLSGMFQRKDSQKHAFFNHSFELPYSNPYFDSVSPPFQEKKRSKHESLDDLQASTYFGPTTITESVSSRRTLGRHSRPSPWPVKSLSLNTDEGPDFEDTFLNSKRSKECHLHDMGSVESEQNYQEVKEDLEGSPSGYSVKSNELKSQDMGPVDNGMIVDHREGVKRFKDKSINCPSIQVGGIDIPLSVSTQTDQSEQRKVKDLPAFSKYGERHSYKLSEEDSEIVSDDISDIFRFLDDMSMSDSLGILQASRYNSIGSLTRAPKSDEDSSPETNAAKLSKAGLKLDRLFQSLENTDGELKASVCKLVLRIGEIEKKLESLSGVRGEISQVLSKLNKLDEKIQEPEVGARPSESNTANETHPESSSSPGIPRCQPPGNTSGIGGPDWCCSDASASNTDSLRVKALKKTVCTRRSSRSLAEENGVTETKICSMSNSPRNWRSSCASHVGEDGKEKDRGSKDRHRKSKEAERQCEAHRPSKQVKEPYLVEQVFTPHRFPPAAKFPMRSSPVYAGMRLVDRPESKRTQPPSWPLEEFKQSSVEKAKLSTLELQASAARTPSSICPGCRSITTVCWDTGVLESQPPGVLDGGHLLTGLRFAAEAQGGRVPESQGLQDRRADCSGRLHCDPGHRGAHVHHEVMSCSKSQPATPPMCNPSSFAGNAQSNVHVYSL